VSSLSSKATVALIRCPDYEPDRVQAALRESLDALGGLGKFVKKGEKVLIKPNLISPLPREKAGQTDPEMIVQLAIMLKELGAKPFVGDSPAWGRITDCIGILGIGERLKWLGVPVVELGKPKAMWVRPSGAKVGISRIALEADKIINLPKLKGHGQMGATIAVKNMFGCVSGKAKAMWHFRRGGDERTFSELLLGVYNATTPVLNIVDGIVAMEGRGPMNGQPRKLGIIVASENAFACEMVCAEIIGIAVKDLPILRTAVEMKMADFSLEEIAIKGSTIRDCACHDFAPATRIPIKFKLLRVCKSILKQVFKLLPSPSTRQA
jgi:uncharacterized protein (DUF362 family)